ncbi:hypothetical protein [Haloarcula amylovorans]|uniref:hypothetical protein n=1 Tax=Haloarcula amylovorans TaxID=2562280 RepID=UPI001075EBB9|nr:hypothetical protein [Halomicroarcula amylolytica]
MPTTDTQARLATRYLVEDLRAAGVIDVIPEEQLLAHSPSGEVFESNQALAYFHAGWTAAKARNDE